MSMPPGVYGRIAPRSGLAVNYGITVGGGVIDTDFRGEVQVILINHGERELVIKTGQRIAQLILEKTRDPRSSRGNVNARNIKKHKWVRVNWTLRL
jgi:dUTP pyrophosphatase